MSVHIRKLLSRKFNNVFLNLVGLLTCVLPLAFPLVLNLFSVPVLYSYFFQQMPKYRAFDRQGFGACSGILKKWQPPRVLGTKLTVAGTVPDYPIQNSEFGIHN